jgi:GxxExxY protein
MLLLAKIKEVTLMSQLIHEELSTKLLGMAFTIHNILGPGLLEAAYEEAFCVELMLAGIPFERQKVYSLSHKGFDIGGYIADIVVGDKIILELKSVQKLNEVASRMPSLAAPLPALPGRSWTRRLSTTSSFRSFRSAAHMPSLAAPLPAFPGRWLSHQLSRHQGRMEAFRQHQTGGIVAGFGGFIGNQPPMRTMEDDEKKGE